MRAVPAATPVTTPWVTVATAGFEDDQTNVTPLSTWLAASFACADKVTCAPTSIVALAGVTVTVVGEDGGGGGSSSPPLLPPPQP